MVTSPLASTVWLDHECEHRGYLRGGLIFGGSTLGCGSGGGLGGKYCGSTLGGGVGGGLGRKRGVTSGGTLVGVWGASLDRSVVNRVAVWVRLWVGVGFSVGVPVAAIMSDNCRIAYMVWAPKQLKGVASTGLVRALTRHLSASVTALAKEIAGMAPLWG